MLDVVLEPLPAWHDHPRLAGRAARVDDPGLPGVGGTRREVQVTRSWVRPDADAEERVLLLVDLDRLPGGRQAPHGVGALRHLVLGRVEEGAGVGRPLGGRHPACEGTASPRPWPGPSRRGRTGGIPCRRWRRRGACASSLTLKLPSEMKGFPFASSFRSRRTSSGAVCPQVPSFSDRAPGEDRILQPLDRAHAVAEPRPAAAAPTGRSASSARASRRTAPSANGAMGAVTAAV